MIYQHKEDDRPIWWYERILDSLEHNLVEDKDDYISDINDLYKGPVSMSVIEDEQIVDVYNQFITHIAVSSYISRIKQYREHEEKIKLPSRM